MEKFTKVTGLDLTGLNERAALVRIIKEMDYDSAIFYIVQEKVRDEEIGGWIWRRVGKWAGQMDAEDQARNTLEKMKRKKLREDFNENALKNPTYFL